MSEIPELISVANDQSELPIVDTGGDVEFKKYMVRSYKTDIPYHIYDPDQNKLDTHTTMKIIAPEKRKTSDIMTTLEYSAVVSKRAQQIEDGSTVYINADGVTDAIRIAKLEIEQRKCPLSIRRDYNSFMAEIWDVNELGVPFDIR